MKKLFLMAVCVVMATFAVSAQPQAKDDADKSADKSSRMEQMMQTRLNMLKDELKLTDAQFAAFEPVYRDYRKMLTRVVDRKVTRVKKGELTNENALQVIAGRLANSAATTAVKQQFLLQFAAVIEPLQVEQLYRIDDRVAKEARKVAQYSKQ